MSDTIEPTYEDNTDANRIELRLGGEIAGWVDYRLDGELVNLPHVRVLDGHEGQGLGGMLVRETVLRFAQQGMPVRPTCPFAISYLRHHPDLHPHMDASSRPQAG